MSDRVLRSHSTPVLEEIELVDTENGLVGHVVAPEGQEGQERPANRGGSGGRTRGRSRGRGRGRIPRRAATQAPSANPTRTRGRLARRARSVEVHRERSVSRLESTASAPPEQQAFVTREVLDDKLGTIEAALKTLMEKQDAEPRNKSGGEQSGPPETIVGGQSQETPIEREASRPTRGCSYKEFAACKPPTFKGERDPVVAMRWIMEMETAFDTCKCSNQDKVVYARSMLKADATYWWEMESGGKPSELAKSTS